LSQASIAKQLQGLVINLPLEGYFKTLSACASFILFESIYCSSVGIFTRPEGGFRLLYPNKKVG